MRVPGVRSRTPSTGAMQPGEYSAESNPAAFVLDAGSSNPTGYPEAHPQSALLDSSVSSLRRQDAVGFAESARRCRGDWYCLAAVLLVLLLVRSTVPPHRQYIQQVDWPQYMYPRQANTVPSWTVPVISLIVPPCIFGLAYQFRRSGQELHMMLLGCTSSVLYCGLITDIIKRMVGRPRPDFFARCFPDFSISGIPNAGYPECTGNGAEVVEGMQSFPSGHTSWCTAGLAFVTFWLLTVINTGEMRYGLLPSAAWRFWVSMFPLCCAALIGITRFMDYWHHWTDVASGFVLGLSLAWLNFKLYSGCLRVCTYDSGSVRWDKGKDPAPGSTLDDATISYAGV